MVRGVCYERWADVSQFRVRFKYECQVASDIYHGPQRVHINPKSVFKLIYLFKYLFRGPSQISVENPTIELNLF